MSEWCERMSERRSEWPSTLRVDFIVILPNVRRLRVGVGANHGAWAQRNAVFEEAHERTDGIETEYQVRVRRVDIRGRYLSPLEKIEDMAF